MIGRNILIYNQSVTFSYKISVLVTDVIYYFNVMFHSVFWCLNTIVVCALTIGNHKIKMLDAQDCMSHCTHLFLMGIRVFHFIG
jgi:hypothetical protein